MRLIGSLPALACTVLIVSCGSDEGGNSGVGVTGNGGAAGIAGTGGASGTAGISGASGMGGSSATAGVGGTAGSAGAAASGGTGGTAGTAGAGGAAGIDGSGGSAGSAGSAGTAGTAGTSGGDCVDTGAADTFSFFVTSYQGMVDLSGSADGFGGDLRYNGAATGLDGADAICQELARKVCFGHRTWRAYLSTSTVNAKDRIGSGPWYDHAGLLVSNDLSGLISGGRPAGGALDDGTYDESGIYHDGQTDVNNDGVDDDDHDTMTATNEDGTYTGFSCDDWTSTTATDPNVGGGGTGFFGGGGPGPGGLSGGIMMGHSWSAGSGMSWSTSHGGHNCAAGTNFIQNGPGDSSTVGGGGGYGGFYCFALPQ